MNAKAGMASHLQLFSAEISWFQLYRSGKNNKRSWLTEYLSCRSEMGSSESVISPWSHSHSQLPLPTHLRLLLALNHKIKPSLCQPITRLHLPVWQCSCTYMEETYQAWPLQLSTETSCWMSHLVAVDQNKWFSVLETQPPEVLWPGIVSQGTCRAMLQMGPRGC